MRGRHNMKVNAKFPRTAVITGASSGKQWGQPRTGDHANHVLNVCNHLARRQCGAFMERGKSPTGRRPLEVW